MASSTLGVKKKIVCLDTNFVSDMAKSRLGLIQDARGYLLRDLYSRLASLVSDNKIVCPCSVFHDVESQLCPDELMDEIRGAISVLSGGIRWHHWQTILAKQVMSALHSYSGRDGELAARDWREALSEDPDQHLTIGYAIRAEYQVPGEEVDAMRSAKQEYVLNMRTLPVRETGRGYQDYLEEEARSFGIIYTRPIAQLVAALEAGDPTQIPSAFDAACPTFRLYEWYLSFGGADRRPLALDSKFLAFFASPAFKRVPSVHILASLYAALRFYYPSRTPRSGDANDVRMVAAYMPYCDILATDKFVRDITSRLALEREYAVAVYSLGPKDLPHLYQHLATL